MLEEAESGWFRHTGRRELSVRVRLAGAPANRYSPKPSFQPFEIPLRPRAEAEESIFKFVMETSGCNYGKRPNFHRFFFPPNSPPTFFNHPLPFPDRQARTRHELRRTDANNFEFSDRGKKERGERRRETVETITA